MMASSARVVCSSADMVNKGELLERGGGYCLRPAGAFARFRIFEGVLERDLAFQVSVFNLLLLYGRFRFRIIGGAQGHPGRRSSGNLGPPVPTVRLWKAIRPRNPVPDSRSTGFSEIVSDRLSNFVIIKELTHREELPS